MKYLGIYLAHMLPDSELDRRMLFEWVQLPNRHLKILISFETHSMEVPQYFCCG